MKQRKLVTLIKQNEVAEIESRDSNDGKIPYSYNAEQV